ncbi:ABC transporter ATP-binding protein [Litchfieldia alkalitelluris]|uniref:ABC transporter ATP-binding protein n=1 Tax=Litchfieldia alkalitelluris TaxID=304268 RepID=UPI000996F8F1|nr:ABC transporter ATP-binding protein [Litchfieldia alkalitelluris]
MAIIQVKDLTKNYGKVQVLNKINLELKQGEVLGFIGPNGAGKSTTIKVLLGILKATKGQVTIFGKDAWNDAVEIHQKIAYVPGDVNLWPNLTGGEVIDLFLGLNKNADKNKRDIFIKKFDLDPTKKCRTYSKGNRQKVALVAAFSSDADLFILDEPTSGLDPLMEQIFQECVFDVKRQGKSVLLSSHILSEVEKLCDRVSIIRQGEIIESGSLQELRHLTRTQILVETKEPLVGLEQLQGIYEIQRNKQSLSFQIDTEKMDSVIKHISQFGITRLESSAPTLEDLFMRHYGEGKDRNEGGRS